jgi:putative Mg2+ transporter-C (MgtC) family protein
MLELLENLPFQLEGLIKILFAGILGMIIGMERSRRRKEAGIRTHFNVATAAALLMLVSLSFEDSARIAAQIVTGVGFLGAGMIFFRRENLHGLTTAAGIWATAGIGMACGAGLFVIAVGTTLIIVTGLAIFHTPYFKRKENRSMLMVKFSYNDDVKDYLQKAFVTNKFTRFKAYQKDNEWVAEAVIHTKEQYDAERLMEIVKSKDGIHSIERLEDW